MTKTVVETMTSQSIRSRSQSVVRMPRTARYAGAASSSSASPSRLIVGRSLKVAEMAVAPIQARPGRINGERTSTRPRTTATPSPIIIARTMTWLRIRLWGAARKFEAPLRKTRSTATSAMAAQARTRVVPTGRYCHARRQRIELRTAAPVDSKHDFRVVAGGMA